MPEGNAWKHAPARQARLQMDMRDPECIRRQQVYREARGKVLGHFDKKRLVAEWNIDWNKKGRPAGLPDFREWLEQNRARLTDKRDAEREMQTRIEEGRAGFVDAGPASGSRP